MKYYLTYILLLVFSLEAKEALKKSLLERIVQPKLSFESSYLNDSSINGYDGSVSVAKNKISLNNKIASFSYTNWSFLWNNINSLPFGNGVDSPIKKMHSLKVNANLPYKINEKWFLLSSLSIKSTFEKETDNSYAAGVFSFASYKLTKEHAIQMGAFINYHPTSTLALPVLSYSYRARQRDGLQVVLGFPRAYVGYHYNEDILLRLGMVYSQSLIKLSDNNVMQKSGYIEAKDYMSNIGIMYDLNENIKINIDALYSIKRDFIMYDKYSDELQSYSIKPSLGMSARLVYIF